MSNTLIPNENDVVSGRGSGANRHKGNLHFRTLIKDRKSYYLSLSKNLKMGVAREIFDEIASFDPPGRFLQKNPETDTWFQVRRDRALEKISQALREKPHTKKVGPSQHQMHKIENQQPMNPDGSSMLPYANFPQYPQQQHPPHPPHQQYAPMNQPMNQPPMQLVPVQNVPMASMPSNVSHQQHAYQQQQQQSTVSQQYMGGNQMYGSHHQQPQQQGNRPLMMQSPTRQHQNFQYSQSSQQHQPYSQPTQQMHQSFSQNQPYQNTHQATAMPGQDSMNKQAMYNPSQVHGVPSNQSHNPNQHMYMPDMPSIPEVPREYLVETGAMYKRREMHQEPQMYVNGPPPPMASQQNSYYTGDVAPATPVHRPMQSYPIHPYEQKHPMQPHGSMQMQPPRSRRVDDRNSSVGSSDEDSLRDSIGSRKRKTPGSPSSHGSHDTKRRQMSKDDSSLKEPSALIHPQPETDKIGLTLDTNEVENTTTTAALISPQNDDDDKSPSKDIEPKDSTDAEKDDEEGKGSRLSTLSTAASMVSHQ